MKTLPSVESLLAASAGITLLFSTGTASAYDITYIYDRSTVYSDVEMARVWSSGESLADLVPAQPDVPAAREAAGGDIAITFVWADLFTATGVWNFPPGSGTLPGVSFAATGHSGFIGQTGDTFGEPWEIRNGDSTAAITRVVLSARGTPDMGFDTDDGSNANHGAAGFPLIDVSLLTGDLTVTYDWWNNWNDTTDMFHRMTLDFATPLPANTSFVFLQDTDEIPAPAPLALLGLGLVGLRLMRRRPA